MAGDIGHAGRRLDATGAAIARLGERCPYDALRVARRPCVSARRSEALLSSTVFGSFGAVLDQGTPLLAVLGNHDVLDGHGDAQMQLLGMDARWWQRNVR